MSRIRILCLALAGAMSVSLPASAALLFTLTKDNCSGTCGKPPFGTVLLQQVVDDPFSVDVTVTLTNAQKLISSGGSHQTFAFNISNGTATPPTVTISKLTDKFIVENGILSGDKYVVNYATAGTLTKNVSNFGYFDYLINWTGGNGGGHGSPGPLSFRVTEAGHPLTPYDFIAALDSQTCTGSGKNKICKPSGKSTGYNFAADVLGSNGKTGEVAAEGAPEYVPEPATIAIFGAALFGMGAARRRRANPHRA